MESNEQPEKLFCVRCGAENFEHHIFCATCGQKMGEPLRKESRSFKFWVFFGLGLVALLYILSLFKPASQNVVSEQLKAVKEGRNTEAYYAFTSKDYQKKISLQEFRKFLENNPELVNYKTINAIKEALNDPYGTWEGTLLLNDGSLSKLNYQFIKESGQWKVLKIELERVTPSISQESSKEAKLVVDAFLASLKKGETAEGYYKNTAKSFQDEMPLSTFEEFLHIFPIFTKPESVEVKNISVDKEKVVIDLLLANTEESDTVRFTLINAGGEWKIGKIDVTEKKSTLSLLDPRAVLEIEFKALRNHELTKAYYQLGSKEFRETTSYKDFIRFVKVTPTLYDNKKAELSDPLIEGELATINVELTSLFGETSSFQVEMIQEEGGWKLFHMAKQG